MTEVFRWVSFKQRLRLTLRQFLPFLVAAVFLLSTNLAASAIFESVELWDKPWEWSPWRTFTIVLFVLLVLIIFWKRDRLFTAFFAAPLFEARPHLVLFLSQLAEPLAASGGVPSWFCLSGNLERDLLEMEDIKETSKKLWIWEIPLRAIWHHLPKTKPERVLSSVTVVCSKESLAQAPLFFRNVIARYRELRHLKFFVTVVDQGEWRALAVDPQSPPSFAGCRAPDFEKFDELHSWLHFLLKQFRKMGIEEEEVVVDFTGGQKVTSGAALLLTFNRKIKAQYIQTNKPWEPLWFDIVLGFRPTGGMN